VLAAADAAAQLMQLADAEPVGVHYQHDRGVGTSTPTSITVVHTSTSIWPVRKAAIAASFSSAGSFRASALAADPPACRNVSGRKVLRPLPTSGRWLTLFGAFFGFVGLVDPRRHT